MKSATSYPLAGIGSDKFTNFWETYVYQLLTVMVIHTHTHTLMNKQIYIIGIM